MNPPKRGEIWSVDLNPVRGHEQAGKRPCLVISDDLYNSGPAEKHIILPITSKHKSIPYHIEVLPPEGGLRMRSHLMCDDIRSVSRERFVERIGVTSERTIRLVHDSLRTLLGI
jgi:mRNA interferase MazF